MPPLLRKVPSGGRDLPKPLSNRPWQVTLKYPASVAIAIYLIFAKSPR
jgi:hypothetical protein